MSLLPIYLALTRARRFQIRTFQPQASTLEFSIADIDKFMVEKFMLETSVVEIDQRRIF